MRKMASAAMLVALAGAFSDAVTGYPRAQRWKRPEGRPGIKAYRVKRRIRNRMAAKSRARNRA